MSALETLLSFSPSAVWPYSPDEARQIYNLLPDICEGEKIKALKTVQNLAHSYATTAPDAPQIRSIHRAIEKLRGEVKALDALYEKFNNHGRIGAFEALTLGLDAFQQVHPKPQDLSDPGQKHTRIRERKIASGLAIFWRATSGLGARDKVDGQDWPKFIAACFKPLVPYGMPKEYFLNSPENLRKNIDELIAQRKKKTQVKSKLIATPSDTLKQPHKPRRQGTNGRSPQALDDKPR